MGFHCLQIRVFRRTRVEGLTNLCQNHCQNHWQMYVSLPWCTWCVQGGLTGRSWWTMGRGEGGGERKEGKTTLTHKFIMQHCDSQLLESFKYPILLNMCHQSSSFFSVPPISCILVQHAINFEASNQNGIDFHQYTLLTLKNWNRRSFKHRSFRQGFPPPWIVWTQIDWFWHWRLSLRVKFKIVFYSFVPQKASRPVGCFSRTFLGRSAHAHDAHTHRGAERTPPPFVPVSESPGEIFHD